MKSDIWSLGCVVYEITALKPPFRAKDMEGLYKKVLQGEFDRIPNIFSSKLHDVLKMMLNVEPSGRPSCDELLNLPVIKRVIKKLEANKVVVDEDDYQP